MELLTPLQRRLLREIGQSSLRDEFYLTGGTALAQVQQIQQKLLAPVPGGGLVKG